jgi:excisionase family DNA binding protein
MLTDERTPASSLAEYLTVAEAASVLGVSTSTLRNWDRSGKLKARRHPINRYRLYRRSDLEAILQQANLHATGGPTDAD